MAGPVVAIGLGTHSRWQIADFGWKLPVDILAEIVEGRADEYDMTSWPERGDALDHIDASTRAVVAFHLFGIHKRDSDLFYPRPDFYYTRRNHELLELTARLGVPLYVFGDQPTDSLALYAEYNVKARKNGRGWSNPRARVRAVSPRAIRRGSSTR